MKLLTNSYPTAEQNLAFEEYYFKHFDEPTLRIWKNPKAVIVGKHQNALAESNTKFCIQNNIPVLRRISGGGTVYHDVGNFNFSFFSKSENGHQIDYDKNLNIIQKLLRSLGYEVSQNERHDLVFDGSKISGNAQHMSKGRTLHHGTILYDSDKSKLNQAIKRERGIFKDKSVKSVRSVVRNLREIKDLGDSSKFEALFAQAAALLFDPIDEFNADLTGTIEKYFNEDWNYGYGPKYEYTNQLESLKVNMGADRSGRITHLKFNQDQYEEFSQRAIGELHAPKCIGRLIKESNFSIENQRSLWSVLF